MSNYLLAVAAAALLAAPASSQVTQGRFIGGDPGGTSIGLGIFRADTSAGPLYLHEGGTGGMRSILAVDAASRRGIVVLTSHAQGAPLGPLALHVLAGIWPSSR